MPHFAASDLVLHCLLMSHKKDTRLIRVNTPASNLGYLASPPGQFFMGAKLFIGTPWMGNEGVLKKNLVWAMCNCMVSMATHSEFEKGGLPTKLLISQLLLILDY